MSWSTAFKEKLTTGGAPFFAIDFQIAESLSSLGDYVPERFVLHSHEGNGMEGSIPHAIASISGSGQSLAVRSWTMRSGTLKVKLATVEVASLVARKIPRGMLCAFKMSFDGLPSPMTQMGIYEYNGLSGKANEWMMTFRDFGAALQSARGRDKRASADFGGGALAAITAATYVGPGHPSASTSLELEGTSDGADYFFQDNGGKGLVYITPAEGGDAFYLKYFGKSGDYLNNLYQGAVIGTTIPAAAIAGAKVQHVDYIFEDIPLLIERFLIDPIYTRGTMSGPINHMGLDFVPQVFNISDWDEQKSRWGEYQTFKADWISKESVVNPIRELEKFLARFGVWLVVKEGALSWRFAQHMLPDGEGPDIPLFVDYEINDNDIISLDRYAQYSSDARDVNMFAQLNTFTTGGSIKWPTTLPAIADDTPRLLNYVFNDNDHASNQTNASTNVRSRLTAWYQRVPETFTFNLTGWRWAELAPGDVCSISSNYIHDLSVRSSTDVRMGRVATLQESYMMVTSVNVNWNDFSTTVEFTKLPQKYNPYI